MEEDWRLLGREDYLMGEELIKARFVGTERNDHEHCTYCWAKFYDKDETCLQEGYCTKNRYDWICEQCFQDFKVRNRWKVIADETELMSGKTEKETEKG